MSAADAGGRGISRSGALGASCLLWPPPADLLGRVGLGLGRVHPPVRGPAWWLGGRVRTPITTADWLECSIKAPSHIGALYGNPRGTGLPRATELGGGAAGEVRGHGGVPSGDLDQLGFDATVRAAAAPFLLGVRDASGGRRRQRGAPLRPAALLGGAPVGDQRGQPRTLKPRPS